MNSPFSGFSLLIHLVIIGAAWFLSGVMGQRRWNTFKTRFSSIGTTPVQILYFQTVSILIIMFLASSVTFATTIAIQSGIRVGAREPQVIFIKEFLSNYIEGTVEAWGFAAEIFEANEFPDFAVSQIDYVRTTKPY